jgi:dihydroorotase
VKPTRREFSRSLLGAGMAVLANGPARFEAGLGTQGDGAGTEYELLIKGGTVIDPSQKLRGAFDVAVEDGKIAKVSPDIPANRSRKVVSAKDCLVTPGLVDIHVHVYEGVTEAGLNADRYCIARGVTTAVDAGSAGYPSIAGFREYVIKRSATRLYALLDIGALGTVVGVTDTLLNLRWVNPEAASKAANANRPSVLGIKARLSKDVAGSNDMEVLKRARQAAESSNLPMMLHVGDTNAPMGDILRLLRAGDIITHCYTPRPHGIVDGNGKILDEVREARQRGVLFDVGHGTFHFGFDLTERCLQQGFLPDTISSDLAGRSVNGPTFDFVTTLSKFLLLGLTVEQVIELATLRPARTFQYGVDLGTLKPGSPADISILELRDGQFELTDSVGSKRVGRQVLRNVTAIRDGNVFERNGDANDSGSAKKP